jgi:hypothetical protein
VARSGESEPASAGIQPRNDGKSDRFPEVGRTTEAIICAVIPGAPSALPRFLVFVLLALAGPGVAVQRILGLAVDAALVLPCGLALCAGAQWLSLVTGLPWLGPVLLLALDLALLFPRGSWRWASGPTLRGAVVPFLAIVAVLAVCVYPWNRVAADGSFLLDPLVAYDTAFHAGLTWELTQGWPPQVPGVSGYHLGYHLAPDLVRAAAVRWAGVHPYDCLSRYEVTLGVLALIVALRSVTARLGGSALAVAIVPWTLLAGDLAWAFGADRHATWWTDLLRGNVLVSLVLSNPLVPALCVCLAALIALSRFVAGEGRAWLALSAGLAFALPYFKVFLGAHLALGLGVAWLIAVFWRRDPARLPVLVTALACAVATVLLVSGRGGATVEVALAPLDLVRVTREDLGSLPLHGGALALFAVGWLVCSLGIRVFGLWSAGRGLRALDPIAPALATIALTAWPLGMLLRVAAPEMLAGQRTINDAAYLIEQGGPILWIFTAIALASLAARWRIALLLAALMAAPTTLQFVARKVEQPPDPLPAAMVSAMTEVAKASAPGDVVLERPMARYPPPPVILIGRRVPYERFTPWLTQFVPAADLDRRHELVYRFFRTTDADEARAIAGQLGARVVCLFGADRIRFPRAGILTPIVTTPGAECSHLESVQPAAR